MHYNNTEENIGFHLMKVKGAAMKGKEAYRAVLDHNSLSAEEMLDVLITTT